MEPLAKMPPAEAAPEAPLQVPNALQVSMVTETALAALPMPEMSMMASAKLPELALEASAKLPEMSMETPPKLPEMPMELPVKLAGEVVAGADIKPPKERRKNLSDQQRVAIVHFLLANSAGGRLKHGDMKAAATHFGVHRATIRRLWKLHTATSTTEGLAGNVASRIKGHSGRKPKVPDEELKIRIAAIPAERRMTGRGLSTALDVSNSVVVRLIKSGKLRRHPKKLHYIM